MTGTTFTWCLLAGIIEKVSSGGSQKVERENQRDFMALAREEFVWLVLNSLVFVPRESVAHARQMLLIGGYSTGRSRLFSEQFHWVLQSKTSRSSD